MNLHALILRPSLGTASQRFTLLTAGQLALGDWRAPMPQRRDA
jgi:hypothetical protein